MRKELMSKEIFGTMTTDRRLTYYSSAEDAEEEDVCGSSEKKEARTA
jgi:hypothetical protein